MERKSLADLVSSLTGGKLRYALGELAALPRAAVVVEDRYSQVFKLDRVRPAVVADGLAELQIRWPTVPIVFCETRQLAEEWTYRFLAAAHAWASTEHRPATHLSRQPVEATDLDGTRPRRNPAPPKSAPGPAASACRARPRPTPPRHLAGLARRPATVTIPSAQDHENNQIRFVAKPTHPPEGQPAVSWPSTAAHRRAEDGAVGDKR